jgi:predicted nucleotidyltransferase component of viral defense system
VITQQEISRLAFSLKMSDRVIEKDYVITRILLALADSELGKLVVFKGGRLPLF